LATDRQSVASGTSKVQADERAAASASEALAQADASASIVGPTSSYTLLPPVGRIVRRGGELYAIGGQPVILLYGAVPQWRAFVPGMTPGRDVAELNANLRSFGYGATAGEAFTSATESAIARFQSAHKIVATGSLLVGSVTFEPGAIRVTTVTPTTGSPVQPGPVLGITSERRVVTIELDASQQSSVKVGDAVLITLPDNSTTPGRVSYVGTVATTPSDQNGGGGGSPTIEVDVAPGDPGATGRLDQAPVDVSITTQTVDNALAVPVNALLALASRGYAVEVVTAGAHALVGVTVGLFDDADGLVQVTGAIRPGQRVVVPAE
jgi:peptidoglycan hydrolase-like protein with peptidoglycan-binding domain